VLTKDCYVALKREAETDGDEVIERRVKTLLYSRILENEEDLSRAKCFDLPHFSHREYGL